MKLKGYDVQLFKTPPQIAKGLMFKEPIPSLFVFHKEGLHTFHTFFCKKMDILFFNRDGKRTEKRLNVKPFRLVIPKKRFAFVLELPPEHILNTLKELKVER